MVRKSIIRTMETSTIHGCKLTVADGEPKAEKLEPITVMGKVNEKEALKALYAEYGKETGMTVAKIDVTEDKYEISVADFLAHAKKLEKAN